MSINAGLFSSEKQDWETPQDLFDKLNRMFRFTVDVCATKENTKCDRYFSPEDDGLSQSWADERCFMNPPYGREIGKWVEKAYKEAKYRDALVVCLLPARTDTRWFHEYCKKGNVEFLRGRLKFGGSKNSAPFPSMIVTF